MTVLLIATILVAAMCQRATGMGFAMVLAPFAVLILGPISGVVVVNVLGIASALLVLARVHRDVEWRAVLVLCPPAVVGIVAAVLLSNGMETGTAQVVAGSVMLAALLASVLVRGAGTARRSLPAVALAGMTSGATTAIAGMGGSAMVVLALVTRWEPRVFAATMQPFFAFLGVVTIVVRHVTDPRAWTELGAWAWFSMALAMVVGTAVAERLRWSQATIQRAVVVVAAAGAVIAVLDGALVQR